MAATNTRVMKIGPREAAKLLDLNKNNRPKNMRHVDSLAAAMSNGEWRQTGEPIRICSDGTLQDGQHRLMAVMKSNQTIEFHVVSGISQEAFDFIDIGMRRNQGQMLARRGEKHYALLAAALAWLHAWKLAATSADCGIFSPNGLTRPRMAQVQELLVEHPGIREFLTELHQFKLLTPGLAVALRYIFSLSDDDKSRQFFAGLSSGENLSKTSPIYHLRERLILDSQSRAKLSGKDKCVLVVKAWNMFKTGTVCRPSSLRLAPVDFVPKIA